MSKRKRSSGGEGDPGEDKTPKRSTRSSSKSPGAANPQKATDPPLPSLPKNVPKPKPAKPKPRGKGKKVTWEPKPEKWLENLPDNHGTYESKALRMSKAIGKYG